MGCFKHGLLEGYGNIFFSNGDVCEGLFKEGECGDCCKYIKPYGTTYLIDGISSRE